MSVAFDIPALQRMSLPSMRWFLLLIGLSVPISVALDNVLLGLLLLGALFSLGSIAHIARAHPVARAALLLFAALLFATAYGATPLKEAFSILAKYVDLLFIPVFIFFLSNESLRRKARYAFLAALALTLLVSYMVAWQILPVMQWMNISVTPDNPVIFHSHITQNNMMAFATFLALLEWRDAATSIRRIGWGAFALLGAVNVLFMVQGRTGYLILLVLLGWFAWKSLARHMHRSGRNWNWRHGSLVGLAFLATAFIAYHTSAQLHDRVALVVSEYQAWQPDHGKLTSTGQRLDFYSNTLQIVKDHALLGVGTGGFPAAFAQQIQGKDVMETQNPHNEYLMVSVQTGVLGLVLLLYLFYSQWRYAPLLPTAIEQDAARGLVLMYLVDCMFNSALHDHADGLFFAFMSAALFAGMKRESQHG